MDYIRILGSFGTKTVGQGTTCIQVSPKVLIDAGNIINTLGDEAKKIEHVFLTHSHVDHIVDLPFLIDLYYADQKHTLQIYALKETIESLKNHLFNFEFYPDFSQINLQNSTSKALEFNVIEFDKEYEIDDVILTPFQTNHTVASCGYIITKAKRSIMFSADTYCNDRMWEILNQDKRINALITEVSFPSDMEALATASKHYTPRLLHEDLQKLQRHDLVVHLMHLKPNYFDAIKQEIIELGLLRNKGQILHEGFIVTYDRRHIKQKRELSLSEVLDKLVQTGLLLSVTQNPSLLEEQIVKSAMELTRADAGTLYLIDETSQQLHFKVIVNESMDLHWGGSNETLDWAALDLYDNNCKNFASVATACALDKRVINIPDVYATNEYNFSSTKAYDTSSGYRSKSMLVVPICDHERTIIGVLQLINKKDILGDITAFDLQDEVITRSLALQAAVSINTQKLISDLETLLESFLSTINHALDEKSPYSGGHIGRMVDLSVMLAQSIHEDQNQFRDKHYSKDELKQLRISALMHDIGKIVMPEHIMDKQTKLETIFDRIMLVRIKAEVIKRDQKIALLEQRDHVDAATYAQLERHYHKELQILNEEIDFLTEANQGSENFSDASIERVKEIAKRSLQINGVATRLLNQDEVNNLCVQKGTLTQEQREEINHHADVSLKMLRALSFPKKLAHVPEIVAGHHEKMNGSGYPLGLKGEAISFEARILAIADIFDALTTSDRPYKKAKKLSEAMQMMWLMAKENEIDAAICRYFYESGVYKLYAQKYLSPDAIDEVYLDFDF